LNKWDNLETFLEAEISRIAKLFDSKGREIDVSGASTPG